MSKYVIVNAVNGYCVVRGDYDDREYFTGYDFMGSVNWSKKHPSSEYVFSKEIAMDIIKDLEAADEPDEPEEEPETDPVEQQMKSLQQSLDTCRSRRNDAWDSYDKLRTMENPNEGLINNAYRNYEKEQSFYEGFMMAVFAAGYTITTAVGTDECTIVKEAK